MMWGDLVMRVQQVAAMSVRLQEGRQLTLLQIAGGTSSLLCRLLQQCMLQHQLHCAHCAALSATSVTAAVFLSLQFPASVRGMCRNPDGMSEDDDNQDVQYALETLQSLRERQRGLEAELAVVLHAHQQHLQQQQYAQHVLQQHGRSAAAAWEDAAASGCYGESEYSSVYAAGLAARGAAVCADIKEASVGLVLALAAAGAAGERPQHQQQLQLRGVTSVHAISSTSSLAMLAAAGTASRSGSGIPAGSCGSLAGLMRNQSGASTLLLQQQGLPGGLDSLVLVSERQTVVWWAQEQLQGALDAIAASRVVLALLRNEAGLLKVRQRDSMGVSLTVDTIDWALSKGNTVIVQGELQVRRA